MNDKRRPLAAARLLFMLPAVLFMGAVVVQNLRPLQYEPAHSAHRIVMWYAGRMWTLWVLLLALPLIVLVTGCVTFLGSWSGGRERPQTPHQTLAAIRASRTMQLMAAITITAGAVLLIAIVHMLAT